MLNRDWILDKNWKYSFKRRKGEQSYEDVCNEKYFSESVHCNIIPIPIDVKYNKYFAGEWAMGELKIN